jgi:DNA-binding transcriptional LysR family regulator
MRYTFKQLEYFVAVAEGGSISSAVDVVHVSAPSISAAISQLEEELEVRLFIRQANGLQLTPIGREVLDRAKSLLDEATSLHSIGSASTGELRGKISLGCLTTLAPLVLPEICQTFSTLHPAVSVELMESSQDQLIGYMRRGIADLVITYDMHLPPDLRFESLVGLPPMVMLSANHRLAGSINVDLKDMVNDPYILLDLPLSRDYFLSVFDKSGVIPNIRMRSTHFEVVRTLVANDFGFSITVARPNNEQALDGKPIVTRVISNPLALLDIGVLSRKTDFSNLALALKKHIQTLIGPDSIPGMRPLKS